MKNYVVISSSQLVFDFNWKGICISMLVFTF